MCIHHTQQTQFKKLKLLLHKIFLNSKLLTEAFIFNHKESWVCRDKNCNRLVIVKLRLTNVIDNRKANV